MRWQYLLYICVVGLTIVPSLALGWEVSYEGNVLPNSSELGTQRWQYAGAPTSMSTDGSVLHLVDTQDSSLPPGTIPCFYREGVSLPIGTPATIEARVRVLSAVPANNYSYAVGLGVASAWHTRASIGLWPDKVGTWYPGDDAMTIHPVDLTQFHTFRIAMNDDERPSFQVWMDGDLIFSGLTDGGGDRGVYFGSSFYADATSDSYWDYVRYSKSYVPVPEPAAVMGLGMGLVPLAGALARRRRKA